MIICRKLIGQFFNNKNHFFSSFVNANESLTDVAEIIATFGGKKINENNFLKAEDLVKYWRTLFYPKNECGSRSYALIGKKRKKKVFIKHLR